MFFLTFNKDDVKILQKAMNDFLTECESVSIRGVYSLIWKTSLLLLPYPEWKYPVTCLIWNITVQLLALYGQLAGDDVQQLAFHAEMEKGFVDTNKKMSPYVS